MNQKSRSTWWIAAIIIGLGGSLALPMIFGQAFTFRDQAFIGNNVAAAAGGGGGGPNVWYDSTATTDGSFGEGGAFADWVEVVVAQGGTASKIRVRVNITDSQSIKVGLFNTSSNLVTGTTGTAAVTSADNGNYVEITGLTGTVTAGTYYVYLMASGSSGFRVAVLTGQTGRGNYASGQVYATAPPSSLPAPSGQEGAIMQVGVFVQ